MLTYSQNWKDLKKAVKKVNNIFTGFFTAFRLTASAFMFMGLQNKNL